MSTDRESDAERFATLARESLRVKDADGHLYLRPSVIRYNAATREYTLGMALMLTNDEVLEVVGQPDRDTVKMLAKRIAEENPTQDRATIDAEATKQAQYQRVATVASHAESCGDLRKFNLWRTQVEGGIIVSLRDATVSMDSETLSAVPRLVRILDSPTFPSAEDYAWAHGVLRGLPYARALAATMLHLGQPSLSRTEKDGR